MVQPFVYHNRTKIYFGNGELDHLHEELAKWGTRVLLVYGGGSIRKNGLYDKIVEEIDKAGLSGYEISGVKPNPEVPLAARGAKLCREKGVDLILACGGGSVIDSAKVMAGSALYEGSPWDLVVEKVRPDRAIPLITVPTMAATGSEMNDCAVITNPVTHQKYGWSAEVLRPRVSFLCPENTYSVSPFQTACGSADILSHLLEVYLNQEEGFDSIDGYMEAMMRSVIRWAPLAMEEGNNEEARANLMWDSVWAINDLTESGHHTAWSCHGMEHELSAFYDIPHGLGLAILTPAFLRFALREETLPRLCQFAINVMGVKNKGDREKVAKKGIKKLTKFLRETLQLPSRLSDLSIDDTLFERMAEGVISWKGQEGVVQGFVPLRKEDILEIYRKCL